MDISKLPKWAQSKIANLERERGEAIRQLNRMVDEQTPSSFYIDDTICSGEERGPSYKRRYIQSHDVEVEHLGVHMRVLLRDDHIDLSWGRPDHALGTVVFQPSSYQQARLFLPKWRA